MVDPRVIRSIEEARAGLLASLGSWGVVSMHWLPDANGEPALWITTVTESQREALEAATWLPGQVTMLLARAQMPYETSKRLRLLVESEEGHRQLMVEPP